MQKKALQAVAVLVMLFAATAQGTSQTASAQKIAKVKDYFRLVHLEATINQVMDQTEAQAQKLVTQMFPDAQKSMTPEQRKLTDDFMKRVSDVTRESMSWSKLEPAYADLYAAILSDEELDAAIAFYKSAAGQGIIGKQSELVSRSQVISQERLAVMQPILKEALEKYVQSMVASAGTAKRSSK